MEKVNDQLKFVVNNHSVTHHRLLAKLAQGVKETVEEQVPDLELRVGQKSTSSNNITLHITGNVKVENYDELERTNSIVRQIIDSLKNQSNLISTIK